MKPLPVIRCSPKPPLDNSHMKNGLWPSGQSPFCFFLRTLLLSSWIIVAVVCLTSTFAGAETPTAATYLSELKAKARVYTLADDREWHLLLHYRPRLSGGFESEQDDPGFFLS